MYVCMYMYVYIYIYIYIYVYTQRRPPGRAQATRDVAYPTCPGAAYADTVVVGIFSCPLIISLYISLLLLSLLLLLLSFSLIYINILLNKAKYRHISL